MRIIFILFFISFSTIRGFSQFIPERSEDALIRQNNVKSSKTYFFDERAQKNHLIQQLDYDQEGRLKKEFLLYLWDVVTYSYNNTFTYNSDHVTEILKIQEILNLYPRDKDYIESFGDAPVNEKIVFTYNQAGQLIKKEIYVFHSDQLDTQVQANQTIHYKYENDHLVLEESTSPEVRVFNYNYSISYDYDSAGNLIRQMREFGLEKPLKRETRFGYDSLGNLVEKRVIDPSAPHNNTHEKYEYDATGRMSRLFSYSTEDEEFLLEFEFQYDDHGRRTSGERQVEYEYLENGLIKSESWKDPKTKEQITFTTEYDYF